MNWNWERLYENLYRYCWVKTGHAQTAEEITQEAFLLFLESHSLRELERQASSLYILARHFCFDFRPRSCGGGSTEGGLEEELECLAPEERELLFLRYSLGFSRRGLTKILEISRLKAYRMERNALQKLDVQNFREWSQAMKLICQPPEPRQTAGFLSKIMAQNPADVEVWAVAKQAK